MKNESFAGTEKENIRFCWNCGAVLEPGFIVCPECGTKIQKDRETKRDPDRNEGEAASGTRDASSIESDAGRWMDQTAEKKSNVALIVILVLLMAAIVACGSILVYKYHEAQLVKQTNQAAADEVIELIDELGEPAALTLDSKEQVSETRTSYNELTKEQKNLVTNYQSLKNAEAAIAELEKPDSPELPDEPDIPDVPDVPVRPVEPAHDNEYIFADSDSRYISSSELNGMTADEIRLGLNELYARHGRRFNDEYLQSYFNSKTWYEPSVDPDDFSESVFNSYEKANKDLLAQWQADHGYR